MKKIFYTLLLVPFLFGCDDNDNFYNAQEQLAEDIEIIKQYIADNNIDAIEDGSGLYYVIEDEGTGTEFPSSTANVTLAYTGYLLDGTVFDSADSVSPIIVRLNNVIGGWQIGVPKFKIDGKGKLIIPSPLAYGQGGGPRGTLPSNSILIFDIELLDFTN